jgi:hypothetical protein
LRTYLSYVKGKHDLGQRYSLALLPLEAPPFFEVLDALVVLDVLVVDGVVEVVVAAAGASFAGAAFASDLVSLDDDPPSSFFAGGFADE